MAETPRLDLPYIAASMYQKEVIHNQSLDRLDLLVQCAVLDRNLATPPGSPALGDAYIVAAGATGAWATHDQHLALWVSSQWQFIAPLAGFQCWVIDEAVQVYWNGTAWTIVSAGGGGATTFLALTDTPNAYGGQAGKTLLVNVGETALEFGTSAGAAPVDAAYVVGAAHAGLSAERVLTNNTTITWDLATAGQVGAIIAPDAVTFAQMQPVNEGILLGRSTAAPGDIEEITPGSGLTLSGGILNIAGGAVTSFLALTDTPDDYSGQAGKAVLVNAGATGLEFGEAGSALASIGATVQRVATQSIAQNLNVAVIFDTEVRDDSAFWNVGQPTRLTVPSAGWYSITAFIQWDATASQTRIVNVRIDGTQYIAVESEGSVLADQRQNIAIDWYLTAGQYVEIILFQTTAATRAITCNASITAQTAAPPAATTFLALADTPDAYTGQGGNLVTVNSGATALDFTTLTAAGRALLDDADETAQRTTLGLGTMATQNATAVAITGGSATGLSTVRSTYDMQAIQFEGLATALTDIASFTGRKMAGTNRWNLYCDGTATNYLQGPLSLAAATPDPNCQLFIRFRHDSLSGILLRPIDGDSGSFQPLVFLNQAGGVVGSISTTATATAYNTSSDVRLKFGVTALTGALEVVTKLRPVRFRWNYDDSSGIGFLAHEAQAVIPESVTGEPDQVDAQGNIVPQGMDHSKLVPWLTGAVQELLAQVEALTARVTELETALGV